MKYITTICAQSVHDHREIIERSYTISAINSFEATNLAARKFWNEIDPVSYSFIHQHTTESYCFL